MRRIDYLNNNIKYHNSNAVVFDPSINKPRLAEDNYLDRSRTSTNYSFDVYTSPMSLADGLRTAANQVANRPIAHITRQEEMEDIRRRGQGIRNQIEQNGVGHPLNSFLEAELRSLHRQYTQLQRRTEL